MTRYLSILTRERYLQVGNKYGEKSVKNRLSFCLWRGEFVLRINMSPVERLRRHESLLSVLGARTQKKITYFQEAENNAKEKEELNNRENELFFGGA